jgi:putative copper export protein
MAVVGLVLVCFGDAAYAQGAHSGAHSGGASSSGIMGGIEHGVALAATVLLAGLAPFATLVWLPASKNVGAGRDAVRPFGLLAWVLLYVLAIAGVGELSAYATLASGKSLSLGLLREALFDTRVGHIWLARFGFALLTAALVTTAARSGRTIYWWAATGTAALLLMTLSQLSHAAAEGRFLPFFADWLHVSAATVWAGGLLGFVLVFFSGPLDAVPAERRAKLREQAARRFSRLAIGATMVLAATGLYAILLHVPNLAALVGTPYGRALLTKLGLLTLVFALGGASFLLRSHGPFGRLVGAELILALAIFMATGFLTSLPPATAVSQEKPTKDVEVLEVELDPVGDSVTSGTATFRERFGGVELTLEAAGLPKPGASYFSQIHEGACGSGQQGRDAGPEYAEVSRSASPVMVRFELLSSKGPEYAHGGGHPDADAGMMSSDDGTAAVVTQLEDYKTVDELLSGGPKYIDIHASGSGDPTIACGEIN